MALPKTGDPFIDRYAQDAVDSQRETGVPASVTLAQAVIESARGESDLTKKALNFFGMKGKGTAGSVVMKTAEWSKEKGTYYINASFRAYHTAKESFVDHGKLFTRMKRYEKAMAAKNDAKQFAREIQAAGYATDPNYAQKLISIIDRFGLTRFDRIGSLLSEKEVKKLFAQPPLSIGQSGARVRKLQEALVGLGFLRRSEIDGEFGPHTKAAVEAFQDEAKLSSDGRVGPNTLVALKARSGVVI